MSKKSLNYNTYLHFISLQLNADIKESSIGNVAEDVVASVSILNSEKYYREDKFNFVFNNCGLCYYSDDNTVYNISENWARYLLKVELVGEDRIEEYYDSIKNKEYSLS